jgi:hypothetical protein
MAVIGGSNPDKLFYALALAAGEYANSVQDFGSISQKLALEDLEQALIRLKSFHVYPADVAHPSLNAPYLVKSLYTLGAYPPDWDKIKPKPVKTTTCACGATILEP